jgi:hypothetical protein
MPAAEVAENGTVCVPEVVWTTSRKLVVVLALPTGTIATRAAGRTSPSTAQAPELTEDGTPAGAGWLAEGDADRLAGAGADGLAEGGADEAAGDGADLADEGGADEADEGGPDRADEGGADEADEGGADRAEDGCPDEGDEGGADRAEDGCADEAAEGTGPDRAAEGSAAVCVRPMGGTALAAADETGAEGPSELTRAGPPPGVTTRAVAVPPAISAAASTTAPVRRAVRRRRTPCRMRSSAPGRAVTGRTASSSSRARRSGLSGGVMTIPQGEARACSWLARYNLSPRRC